MDVICYYIFVKEHVDSTHLMIQPLYSKVHSMCTLPGWLDKASQ